MPAMTIKRFEYQGWHIICAPQEYGWWRLRAECPAENLTATIYDDSMEHAMARMTDKIHTEIDRILCASTNT